MIDSTEVELVEVFAHRVGNKLRQEGLVLSNAPLKVSKELRAAMLNYFFNHFRDFEVVLKLTHPAGDNQNAIYAISSRIFSGEALRAESEKAAAHLYDVSDHPRIKEGAFYIAYFRNLRFNGKIAEAIGYFKSDHSDQFLTVNFSKNQTSVMVNEGMRVKSFDKGALVIGLDRSDGYRVVQSVSQSAEASYWIDQFLKATPIKRDAEYTKELIGLCRRYGNVLEAELGQSEKARFLDVSYSYLKQKNDYNAGDFQRHLPENLRAGFEDYRTKAAEQAGFPVPEHFEVSATVVKRHKKAFSASIRLDGCVDIKVDPQGAEFDSTRIEKGYDQDRGLNYYKIYFTEEK